MVSAHKLQDILRDINGHTGWRFAIGVRIRFANPTLLFQTYPQEWVDYYNDNALIFTDPTIRWGLTNVGVCDWDELRADDESGMMARAAEHGLRFGIVVSVGDAASRTLGFFCRADRALTSEEIAFATGRVQQMHDATEGLSEAPEAMLADLRAIGEDLRHGDEFVD